MELKIVEEEIDMAIVTYRDETTSGYRV